MSRLLDAAITRLDAAASSGGPVQAGGEAAKVGGEAARVDTAWLSGKTQQLWCEPGEHEWTRLAVRGRKPVACPEHR